MSFLWVFIPLQIFSQKSDLESQYDLENQDSKSAEKRQYLCDQSTVFSVKICQWILDHHTKLFSLSHASIHYWKNEDFSLHSKEL